MIRVENISNDHDQLHTIDILDDPITVRFLFHETLGTWTMDLNYKDIDVNGVYLAVGVLLFKSNNFPFDFYIEDTSSAGIDPFTEEDLSQRMDVLVLEPVDMLQLRGFSVEI